MLARLEATIALVQERSERVEAFLIDAAETADSPYVCETRLQQNQLTAAIYMAANRVLTAVEAVDFREPDSAFLADGLLANALQDEAQALHAGELNGAIHSDVRRYNRIRYNSLIASCILSLLTRARDYASEEDLSIIDGRIAPSIGL